MTQAQTSRQQQEQEEFSLDDYPDVYLECRDNLHSWRTIGYFRDGGYVSELSNCTRCHSRKMRTMTRAGALTQHSRYEHAEGYLVPRGMGYVDKASVRKQRMQRFGGVHESAEELFKSLQQDELALARHDAAS